MVGWNVDIPLIEHFGLGGSHGKNERVSTELGRALVQRRGTSIDLRLMAEGGFCGLLHGGQVKLIHSSGMGEGPSSLRGCEGDRRLCQIAG